MKERLTQLLEQFQSANAATKVTLALAMLMTLGVVGLSGWFANRPDFVQLYGNLTTAQASAYRAALAEAGIPFRSSPPPENGIWVDSADMLRAEAQVALGSYEPEPKGIQTNAGGAQSAFLSAGERDAMMDKRQWQECELLLETLEFVNRATVQVSPSKRTPFRKEEPPTVAVTLDLRLGAVLTSAQARNVAALVRGRFNVPLENITILDGTSGELLHDGADLVDGGGDLFEQKRRFESDAERKANSQLVQVLGPGMASVTVNSEWIFDETESVKEAALPGVDTYTSKSKDETTSADGDVVGGAAGVSSNIKQDYGTGNAGVVTGGGAGGTKRVSTLDEKRSVVGRQTEHRVSRTPQIKRMSISLTVDESVTTEQLAELDENVKAAVGYVDERDNYKSTRIRFASVLRDDEGNPIPVEAPEPPAQPNAYVELLLTHGVEALAGLAFLFVLMKALKGPKARRVPKSEAEVAAEQIVAAHEEEKRIEEELRNTDPELLARMQVMELVRIAPERVSEILAQWASEELTSTGAQQ